MRSWPKIVIVICLALLQSIAPLLHAHVHDMTTPGKIHFHTPVVDVADTPTENGVFQLTKHLADEDAIGMESVGKNEFDLSISNMTALISRILVALMPSAQILFIHVPLFTGTISSPPYLLPFSIAPPVTGLI